PRPARTASCSRVSSRKPRVTVRSAHELAHVPGAALGPHANAARRADSTSGYGCASRGLSGWFQRRQPLAERRSAARERKAARDVSDPLASMYREIILDHYKNP